MEYAMKLICTTYGFDLTPIIELAKQTGDTQWQEVMEKRKKKDKELFPEFYKEANK